MKIKRFYDIHFHLMDLSHANLTAYMKRFLSFKQISKNIFFSFFKLPVSLLKTIINVFKKNKVQRSSLNKTKNLFSFMESSIKYDFLIVDYFLKNKEAIVNNNNELKVGDEIYNKIVLCPLIMDFGYGALDNSALFYNIPPQKPIKDQILDLFNAIILYYSKELEIEDNGKRKKFIIKDYTGDVDGKLFDILPFMGLNTVNYSYDELNELLNKYFFDFKKEDTIDERKNRLFNKIGKFSGDVDDIDDCKNIFTGIKLYPPLGFDPWPVDHAERDKVILLYTTAVEKNIPLIVHCGIGGFDVVKNAKKLTDPSNRWTDVLEKFPKLKINFAHFGFGNRRWQKDIIKHILKRERVYSDFSYNSKNDIFYKKLNKMIAKDTGLKSKLLFGSDFMINLLEFNSYNQYLKTFINSSYLNSSEKTYMTNQNSEQFLFA